MSQSKPGYLYAEAVAAGGLHRHIGRGSAGDCCVLCGRIAINLPVNHGCVPNLPPGDMQRLEDEEQRAARKATTGATSDRGDFYQELFDKPRERREQTQARRAATPFTKPGSTISRVAGILDFLDTARIPTPADPHGTRNSWLYWAACRIGEMLTAGELTDPHRQADALEDRVATRLHYPRAEARKTIASGFHTSGVHGY